MMETLSVDDVLKIYEVLVADFAGTSDPVSPSGVRSRALLESAVGRQHTSLGRTLKYNEPIGNAATLAFGICCDHPFVNGNKRTALVALLVHLDKNRLCIHRTRESDLYQLMLGVANHTIGVRRDPRRPDRPLPRRTADEEVAAIKDWLAERVERVRRGERPVTFRQLRQLLSRFNITLEEPHSNTVGVFKTEISQTSFFRRTSRVKRIRVATIGYRDEGTEVSLRDIKQLRKMCHLTEDDGIDADAFYEGADVVDAFVNRYRTALRRLART